MNRIEQIATLLKPFHGYTVRGGEVYISDTSQVLSDWEIAGALLERISGIESCGEPHYEIDIEWDRFDCAWDVTIRFEATEYMFGNSDLTEAIIGACIQVPEAQPHADGEKS